MDFDVYKVEESTDRTYFEFNSVGVKGTIKKFVQFVENHEWNDHFNLVLGDIENGKYVVKVVTDNGDIAKVMATVALVMRRFLDAYPEQLVVFFGDDIKRQHLYARTVYRHIHEFVPSYKIIGRIGGYYGKYYELTQEMADSTVIPKYDLFIIRKLPLN